VADPPAVDASPLIFLTKAGRLDYLQLVADEIAVPSAVAAEIRKRGPEDPTAQTLAATPWLRIVESPPMQACGCPTRY